MSIHSIRLEDHEGTSPPCQILEMSIIDGLLFLDMKQYDEKFESDRAEIIAGGKPLSKDHERAYANRAAMAFHLEDFLNAVAALAYTDRRNTQRYLENKAKEANQDE